MTRLNGKTAVITGGATGIGRAAAKRFIEEGAFVFIFGRRQEALDAAVADLGPDARAVKGSVSDEADLDRLYAAVKAERKTLDIVFANAGAGSPLALGKITAEHVDETFDTNVKGTIFTVQKALPLMGKGGSIILTGSSAGTTGAPAMSAYSASKAAVRNLARTWAEDLKGTGIRVNVLSPGATATELAKEALGEEGHPSARRQRRGVRRERRIRVRLRQTRASGAFALRIRGSVERAPIERAPTGLPSQMRPSRLPAQSEFRPLRCLGSATDSMRLRQRWPAAPKHRTEGTLRIEARLRSRKRTHSPLRWARTATGSARRASARPLR